jgi:glycosyltransferase involved in cell wall biosynthesis
MVRNKGVEFLIKAMRIVVQRIPNAKLSLIGRGYFEDKLIRLIRELKLEDHVTLHGYVSEREKIRLLQRAHIIVMPSLREGWATPVIEANACGTPAIGSNVPGIRSAIIDGVTGLVVPYGNIKELAEKIIILLTNHPLHQRMSENAMKWAQNFDQRVMIQKFIKIIDSLIEQ